MDTSVEKNFDLELIDLNLLIPSKTNPRQHFKKPELEQLAASIKKHKGVLQPIIVRAITELPDHYEIIAGERRFKATKKAKQETILCRVIEADDVEAVEIQATENFERENLNPIEEADQWNTLLEVTGLTQEQLAAKYKRSQSYVANMLRLRNLPREWRLKVAAGHIPLTFGRHLTSWVEFPQVFKALPLKIQKIIDNADPDYELSPADYNAALAEAIHEVTVSVANAKFSITPKIKRDLKIKSMPKALGFNQGEERAFNVELFKELQEAAIDEDDELNRIAEAEKEPESKPVQTELELAKQASEAHASNIDELSNRVDSNERIPETSPEEIQQNIDHAQSVADSNNAAKIDPKIYVEYKNDWLSKQISKRVGEMPVVELMAALAIHINDWELEESFLKLHTDRQLMALAWEWNFDQKQLEGYEGQNLIEAILVMDRQLRIQFNTDQDKKHQPARAPQALIRCELPE